MRLSWPLVERMPRRSAARRSEAGRLADVHVVGRAQRAATAAHELANKRQQPRVLDVPWPEDAVLALSAAKEIQLYNGIFRIQRAGINCAVGYVDVAHKVPNEAVDVAAGIAANVDEVCVENLHLGGIEHAWDNDKAILFVVESLLGGEWAARRCECSSCEVTLKRCAAGLCAAHI